MKKQKIMTVVFGIALLVGGLTAMKANAFGPHGPGGGFPGLEFLMELDLSDSQKAGVRDILTAYREEAEQSRAQFLEARKRSMDLILDAPFDEETVRQAFQQISPLLEDGMVLRARLMAEVRALLNADQLELLKGKRIEMSGKMQKGMRLREAMMDTWLQMDAE